VQGVRHTQSRCATLGREDAGKPKERWPQSEIGGSSVNAEYDISSILTEQNYLPLPIVRDAYDRGYPWCGAGREYYRPSFRTSCEQVSQHLRLCVTEVWYFHRIYRCRENFAPERGHILEHPSDLTV